MSAEPTRNEGKENVRRDRRFAVSLAASMVTEDGVVPVQLLDLSCRGALAEARFLPPAGSRVTVLRERMELEAWVVWRSPGRAGIEFERPMKATETFLQLGRYREAGEDRTSSRAAVAPVEALTG